MKKLTRRTLGTVSLGAMLATAALGATPAGAQDPPGRAVGHQSAHGQAMNRGQAKTVDLVADLTPLNGSGVTGRATATVRNQLIRQVDVHATGLTPDAPHAAHIHYGDDARNECPSMADATNTRTVSGRVIPRLSTVDGLPAYGPIVVSLTTTGDTTPASALALGRFPVARDGQLSYSRSNIEFTSVAGTGYGGPGGAGTAKEIADAVRDGEGVVVIHGVDYNGNGRYDFDGAGRSELDRTAPAEATDPAACGVLK